MKRTILTMLIMIVSVVMIGQTNERTSAFNYQRMGKLDLAKEAIDKAAQHEKTIMDPKTWFYRGNIYYDIAVSIDEKYRNLEPDPFGVAFQSYQKAKELDTKGEFADDIERFTVAVGEGYYNMGVIYYNEQKFKESALSFEKSFDVGKSVNRIDTSAIVNAAVASMQANEITMAKKYYEQMLQMGVQQPDVYASLAEIYKAEGDTTLALQKVGEGRLLFPDDFNLLIAETNIYLTTDEKEKAKANLETAIQIDNTNPSIFFAVGTIYDQMYSDIMSKIAKLEIGMNTTDIKNIFSDPIKINSSTNASGVNEQWVYSDLNIYFDNDKLSSWQVNAVEALLNKAESSYLEAIKLSPEEIRVGISTDEAIKIKGEPVSVNRTTGEFGINEQWVYNDQYLYFDKGKLTSWQELNTTSKAPSILFSANYNLGALYVNQAADILDKANDLPLDAVKEYDIQKAKADEMLDKSLPYLEKSLELMPDDVNTMISLKEIYTRLGMTEKLQVINEKLKN